MFSVLSVSLFKGEGSLSYDALGKHSMMHCNRAQSHTQGQSRRSGQKGRTYQEGAFPQRTNQEGVPTLTPPPPPGPASEKIHGVERGENKRDGKYLSWHFTIDVNDIYEIICSSFLSLSRSFQCE